MTAFFTQVFTQRLRNFLGPWDTVISKINALPSVTCVYVCGGVVNKKTDRQTDMLTGEKQYEHKNKHSKATD